MKASIYQERCDRLMASLPEDSVALIPSAPLVYRNRDVNYRYRQDSHLLYLTGYHEPESMLLLSKLGGESKVVFFCRPFDAKKALWDGPMLGIEGTSEQLGIEYCESIYDFADVFSRDFSDASHYLIPEKDMVSDKISTVVKLKKGQAWLALDDFMAMLRVVKSSEELTCIQRAIDMSIVGHRKVMKRIGPGVSERALYGDFLREIYHQGAQDEAYLAIVAGGKNACVLHYNELSGVCQSGDLLLLDAGAEYQGYAADLTRTFPVSRQFSYEQKVLYEHVLNIQLKVIESIDVSTTWCGLNALAAQLSTEALLDMGLLSGDLEALLEQKAYLRFAPHGIGHWMGLDVHDVGFCKTVTKETEFPEYSVFTIEPGIYIADDATDIDDHWRGLGVRIEDNLVLTSEGPVVMSSALEKSVEGLSHLLQD